MMEMSSVVGRTDTPSELLSCYYEAGGKHKMDGASPAFFFCCRSPVASAGGHAGFLLPQPLLLLASTH